MGGLRSVVLAIALIPAFCAGAQANMSKYFDFSYSTTFTVESEYIFRGLQLAEESVQPDFAMHKNGFTLGAWANVPIGQSNANFETELNIYGAYEFDLNETFKAHTGFTYYAFLDSQDGFFDTYDEEKGTGTNTFELGFGLEADLFLNPTADLYYDVMLDTVTVIAGLSHSIPLMGHTSLDLGGVFGHVMDDDPGLDYTYGVFTGNLVCAVTKRVSLAGGVRYGLSSEDTFYEDFETGRFQDTSFWAGMKLAADF